jgi:nicotinate phosphoribosyltransferase
MIINSLIDTDLYKYTMLMAIYHNYPNVNCEFAFKDRRETVFKALPTGDQVIFVERINEELDHLCTLMLTKNEIEYLRSLGYFKETFLSFLKNFKLNRDDITVSVVDGDLSIRTNGSWVQTTLFEVPVLAIVSELNSEFQGFNQAISSQRLHDKCNYIWDSRPATRTFQFADFGTRRRASFKWQSKVIRYFLDHLPQGTLIGTSNLHFARKFGIKAIGTHAHEWFQGHQQLGDLKNFQKQALQVWADEYRGELGIALSDIVGFDNFLKDFDKYFVKLFDGCRHDSGDPFEWCIKLIDHYKQMDMLPQLKTAVFSDGLNFELAVKLHRRFNPFIRTSFGIGTFLTNDGNVTPPSIVMKMVTCNGGPVAKVSDSPGKGMCENPAFLTYLKDVFNIED